jgi:hypothetical protein
LDSYVPGVSVIYTITVSNVGNGDAIGATVSDNIVWPITSWSWACTAENGGASGCDPYSGSGHFSDVVNLPAGGSLSYTVTAQTDPAATSDLTNTVTVLPPSGITDPTPENNTANDSDSEGMDFGDLPFGYSITMLPADGARHRYSGLRLGNGISYEANGQESDNAGSDAHDDGVTFSGNWSDEQGELNVAVSGGDGCLSAWLDFWNGTTFGADNSFDDNYEKIIDNQPVLSGTNPITFTLPSGAADNATMFVRFRIVPQDNGQCSTHTAIGLTGVADGGEVEDYRITFSPTSVGLLSLSAKSPRVYPLWLPLLIIIFGWGYSRVIPILNAVSFLAVHRKQFGKRVR